LATFSWEYTQSSYPHLTSTFLILLACWLAWGAALRKDDLPGWVPLVLRGPVGRSGLAGLVFGFALGVRLDAAFAALALGMPLLTGRGVHWGRAAAMAAGTLVMLAGLAWVNQAKFGVFNPLTYGRTNAEGYVGSLTHYLPVALLSAGLVFVYAFREMIPNRPSRKLLCAVLLVAALALLLTPAGIRFASGLFQILVDMRIRPDHPEPALSRSDGGAVLYFGHVKKALLESCPYLVLLVIPAVRRFLRRDDRPWGLLWLVPLTFAGFYGYLAWHGSVALNMRYLTPTLPFLALLAAGEWLDVRSVLGDRTRAWLAVGLWVGLCVLFLWARVEPSRGEAVFLNGALTLAAVCLTLQVYRLVRPKAASRPFALAFLAAFVWASAATASHDYAMSASVRYIYLQTARTLEPIVEPNAVVMIFNPDAAFALRDHSADIVIANYTLGPQEDAEALVAHFADTRPIYWVTRSETGTWLDQGPEVTPSGLPITRVPVALPEPDTGLRVYHLSVPG
jgi:hypothetical protein